MASTLIIAEDGKVYCVELGDPGTVVELKDEGQEAAATKEAALAMADKSIGLAQIPATGEVAQAECARVIMGTFVNLPLLGDKAD
jgi:hypothetical protein